MDWGRFNTKPNFTISTQVSRFKDGDTSKTFTVTHSQDANSSEQTIFMWLDSTSDGVTIGSGKRPYGLRESAIVTFAQPTYSVDEGGSVNIAVNVSSAPSGTVVIPLATTPASGDFSLAASVTIPGERPAGRSRCQPSRMWTLVMRP